MPKVMVVVVVMVLQSSPPASPPPPPPKPIDLRRRFPPLLLHMPIHRRVLRVLLKWIDEMFLPFFFWLSRFFDRHPFSARRGVIRGGGVCGCVDVWVWRGGDGRGVYRFRHHHRRRTSSSIMINHHHQSSIIIIIINTRRTKAYRFFLF